jgi:hypothetical protein
LEDLSSIAIVADADLESHAWKEGNVEWARGLIQLDELPFRYAAITDVDLEGCVLEERQDESCALARQNRIDVRPRVDLSQPECRFSREA